MPIFEKSKADAAPGKSYLSEKSPDYAVQTPPTGDEAPPPSYAPVDPLPETSISELNSAFSSLNLAAAQAPKFPEPDYCLAHLKLLAAFNALKREVGHSDGLFGIEDSCCEKTESRGEALASLKEKRWTLYVARAVDRFQDWWLKVLVPGEPGATRLTTKALEAMNDAFGFAQEGKAQAWTTSMLPPLDVLMVWHTFMLNPRNYYEDCLRYGLKNVWATGLPWAAVNAAIDSNFNYTLPEEAKAQFTKATGRNWDNSEEPLNKMVQCPKCNQHNQVPWTTCTENVVADFTALRGSGYGDRDFAKNCVGCSALLTHELLCVAKFTKDAEALLLNDWAVGGTLLGADGKILTNYEHNDFLNRLIRFELRTQAVDLLQKKDSPTMDDVKTLVEKAIKDKELIRRVNKDEARISKSSLKKEEGFAIRRMMYKYWDNASIFALELGGAVIRQSVFVEKMQGLDWLHSPVATETMKRLLVKYGRFISIMAGNPRRMVVPTLDVDLGWHTHQLSPKQYYEYTNLHCDRFIDHNDKISEDRISEYFEWTSEIYQKTYKEVYSECTCWYCETIRSRHSANRVFSQSKIDRPADDFYTSGQAQMCPPNNSAHISTHDAVRIEETAVRAMVFDRRRVSQRRSLETAYEAACRKAKKKGRKPPSKDSYFHTHWGTPYAMGFPFLAVPVVVGAGVGYYYAGDTASMPEGNGMHGVCATGTCGPSSSSEAHWYGGSGGCSGGCGGGGGGGGGCGGGGGGGCGGGS